MVKDSELLPSVLHYIYPKHLNECWLAELGSGRYVVALSPTQLISYTEILAAYIYLLGHKYSNPYVRRVAYIVIYIYGRFIILIPCTIT